MIILIRPHYFASASPRMVRDDSVCHYHTKLTYCVHISHKLCVWVRPLCTLAAGRGVHISSTGKGHTKQRSRTSTKKTKFLVCLCRGESHGRALPLSLSLPLPFPLPLPLPLPLPVSLPLPLSLSSSSSPAFSSLVCVFISIFIDTVIFMFFIVGVLL